MCVLYVGGKRACTCSLFNCISIADDTQINEHIKSIPRYRTPRIQTRWNLKDTFFFISLRISIVITSKLRRVILLGTVYNKKLCICI